MPPIESLLSRPLVAVTRGVLRVPRFVLAMALLLAVLSLLISFRGLGFRTSRLDLLDPHSSYNQRWLAYLDEFGDQDDVVVLVEGDDPTAVERGSGDGGRADRSRAGDYSPRCWTTRICRDSRRRRCITCRSSISSRWRNFSCRSSRFCKGTGRG